VVFHVVAINVMLLDNDRLAVKGGIAYIAINVVKLFLGIVGADEPRGRKLENGHQRHSCDGVELNLLLVTGSSGWTSHGR
jgi:hypothetical protein